MPANYKTPSVYIQELNAFPDSSFSISTAIPAFIGYTPQANYNGKSYCNLPTRVTSLEEFERIYGIANPYQPHYYLIKGEGDLYELVPNPNTCYYFYNSIKLFYENGGGDAYIVSVGTYGKPLGKAQKST